jgi:hypothetical protein
MRELMTLWERTLGTPPSEIQFVVWVESYDPEIVRRAILKTAQKNLSVNGTMSENHKIRFASKVMSTASAQKDEHAENREKLRQEFGGNR